MSRDWEQTFASWGAAPSEAEQAKCENAERAIRNAVTADPVLSQRDIQVFTQGSYRNRTNVRQDSDVDICIRCRDTFFYEPPNAPQLAPLGITQATYGYPQFKNEVERALRNHFGRNAVVRGNKAFEIHENSYRIAADAVPCFEYRWYQPDRVYLEGTAFDPDVGGRIFNWPQQNYDNGVAKNGRTGQKFKAVVRCLKRLRYEMAAQGFQSAKAVSSYLIECLVWNVPDNMFGQASLRSDIQWAVVHLHDNTRDDASCSAWTEVNQIKYLFHPNQPWTRDQANLFLFHAWQYAELG